MDDDDLLAAQSLIGWSHATQHRKPRGERVYPLTPEGDLAAWLDRLSGEIAEERATSQQARRQTTTWKPREAA